MNYLIPIIAFLGLIVGNIIAKYTKEEIEQGKVYFYASKRLILFILAVILSLTFLWSMNALIFFIMGSIASKILRLPYSWLGVALAASINPLLIATLIFVYGLIDGTSNRIIIKNALAFFILFSLILTNTPADLLTKFAAGAILYAAIFGEQ